MSTADRVENMGVRAAMIAGASSGVAVLTPAFVLAELRDPLFDVTDETAVLSRPLSLAVLIFLAELLATAAATGGVLGWVIGRTRRAAAATAVAAFALALGPGHNIPLIGGTPGISVEAKIMIPVIVLAAAVLVSVHRGLKIRAARLAASVHSPPPP